MPVINIEGKRVRVGDEFLTMTPDQQADAVDEIAQSIGIQAPAPAEPEDEVSKQLRSELSQITQNASPENKGGFARELDSFGRGAADMMSFGFADELAAAGGALTGIGGDFGDYDRNLRVQRIIQDQRDMADPKASTAGRIAGGVTQGLGLAKNGVTLLGRLPASAGLGAKVGAGAAEGAAYGGAYGFGSGEGASDRLSSAAGGAAAGALIGGAVPAVVAGAKAAAKPIVDAVSARVNPGKYASQKIAERLGNSNMTVEQAARRMEDGGMSLADVGGKTTRNLLRTAANIPGKGADRISTQLTLRQMGQGDRLKAVVGRTLADPDGYMAAKDEIAATAERLARPLYKEAEKTPVHFSQKLEDILNTPAGQAALKKAEVIAGNEQVPFQQLFVNVADDGSATVRRVPDARGWDYIKKGMDDLINEGKDSITKKLTHEASVINRLKNRMLEEIDAVNPAYKAARKAWGGQQSIDDALEFGRDAMKQSPEAVRRQLAKYGPAEKEAARAGAAEWIRNAIDQRNFTQNAILKFFSNRQQYKNLRSLFDNDEQFKTFRQAVFAEAKKRSTYEAVKGNSTTAAQLADMMETGGLQEGFNAAKTAATSGPVAAILQWVGSRLRMLGGFTPEVADSIAQKLMASSPDKVRQVAQELSRLESAKMTAIQRSNAVQAIVTRALQAPVQSMALQPQ
ncbi:hypothetical protein ACLJYM_06445 [Rhizobium giardinii]|uniref:hypothetical protein n=1 Tax=Rhizobium giardinii TaxID=56731 RepID=UPI0039DF72D9